MFLFFSINKELIFIYGIAALSLLYLSIYYMRPWFIFGSIAIVAIAIFYAEANKTQSLQDIGLGAVVGFAFILAVAVNAVWANIVAFKHVLNPVFYQQHVGNFLSLKFLYHFMLPVFLLLMLIVYLSFPGLSQLETACFNGDVKTIERILDGGVSPDTDIPPYHNRTPMSIATSKGHLEVVKLLVERGAHTRGSISTAATNGHFEIVKFLLTKGCNPRYGLDGAISGRHLNIADYLLKNGAENFNFYTLVDAFEHSNSLDDEFIKLLLSKKPQWHIPDKEAIWYIESSIKCMKKLNNEPWSLNLLQILFDSGVKANVHDDYGKTGLLIAVNSDNYEATKFFLEKGANINHKNNVGETALMAADARHGDTRILQILKNNGANVNLEDNEGDTALMKAKSDIDKTKFLLTNKAVVNHKNKKGETALHNVSSGVIKIKEAQLLLKYGADVNIKDENRITPLMLASRFDDTGELVRLYKKYGADINAKDFKGKTPLIYAARNDNEKVIELLLKYGADKSIKDNNGKMAKDYAEDSKDMFF